jgi:hypothetical protein
MDTKKKRGPIDFRKYTAEKIVNTFPVVGQ